MLSLLIGLAAIFSLYVVYKWGTKNNDYFDKLNVRFIKPWFLLGNKNSLLMRKQNFIEFASDIYNAFPNERIIGVFDMNTPVFLARHPDVIKQLTIRDFDYFENHYRPFIDEKSEKMFGNSLIMLREKKWHDMRTILSPLFTGSKMRQMFEMVNDCAQDLAEFYLKEAKAGNEQNHEMSDISSRYFSDVISSTAFGIKVNSIAQRDNEFYKKVKELLNFSSELSLLKMITVRVAPIIMQLLDISITNSKAGKYFKSVVLDTIELRKKNNIFRPDMMNIMMQLKSGGDILDASNEEVKDDGLVKDPFIGKSAMRRQWNDDELVAQCYIFFLGGFLSSSTALSFTVYELTVNIDVQDKLYAEIAETQAKLNGTKLSFDVLQNMQYMDMVVSEGLRMWPPDMFIDRSCSKDYVYDDGNMKFKMAKGSNLWIPVYSLHHDPKYFPNPSKFDPERFSEENKSSIIPGTYIPFGVGPRNCIASRFALMAVKAVIYYLLLNSKFVFNDKTQVPLKFLNNPAGLVTERGINVQFKPR